MDRSRGARRTNVTQSTRRVEPVELPTGSEFEVKFKTDAAGSEARAQVGVARDRNRGCTEAYRTIRLF